MEGAHTPLGKTPPEAPPKSLVRSAFSQECLAPWDGLRTEQPRARLVMDITDPGDRVRPVDPAVTVLAQLSHPLLAFDVGNGHRTSTPWVAAAGSATSSSGLGASSSAGGS